KGLDNVQKLDTPYSMELDVPYREYGKTNLIKIENTFRVVSQQALLLTENSLNVFHQTHGKQVSNINIENKLSNVQRNVLQRPPRYGVSDLLCMAYWASWVRRIELLLYGVLGSLGMAYWASWLRRIELLRYGVLAESVPFLIFDQSIIYDVYTDVDTAYSLKSGNGLLIHQCLGYVLAEALHSASPSLLADALH
ncbi:hypothetical protein Tco_0799121, partial [Tanacetum coccineum]